MSNEAKHTPGPLGLVGSEQFGYAIETGAGVVLADNVRGIGNARLFASAPDLQAALEQAIARVRLANAEGNPILSAWLPEAEAAIAKAKGERASVQA